MFVDRTGVTLEQIVLVLGAIAFAAVVIVLGRGWYNRIRNRQGTADARLGTALSQVPTTP